MLNSTSIIKSNKLSFTYPFLRSMAYFVVYTLNVFLTRGLLYALGFDNGILFTITSAVVVLSLIIAETYFLWVKILKRPWKTIGLNIDSHTLKNLFVGFVFGTLVMLGIFLLQLGLGFIKIDRFVWQDGDIQKSVLHIIDSIILFSAAAFLEEIAFRGYIYQEFKSKFNIYLSLIFSGLIFSFSHAFNDGFGLDFAILGIIGSTFYLFLRNYTGSLWASSGFHFAWNIFQGAILGLATYKMSDFSSVIYLSSQSGPEWLVGKAPSIESGLLYGLVYVIGSAILFQIMNRTPNKYEPKTK